jgi:hypothetical protein
MVPKSISNGAQYQTPAKWIFFTSKYWYLSFATPAITLKVGQQRYMWGTTNSKPLGPIIMIDQRETLRSSQVIFITLFFAGLYSTLLLPAFSRHGKLCNYAEPKPFSWAKLACFDFSSSNCTVHDHIRALLEML